MELNFTKTTEGYVAEFKATGDFNLHIERQKQGLIKVMQKGCENGKYAESFSVAGTAATEVFDCDFGSLVYPKWIKVVSGIEVVKAVATEA